MSYYKNVEEIERDIEILKLKSQIQEEKLKIQFYQMKEDLTPSNLFRNIFADASRGIAIIKIVHSIYKRLRRK